MNPNNSDLLIGFVSAFNRGDLKNAADHLTRDFYGYDPQPGEPTAPETFLEIARPLRDAFPDLEMTLDNGQLAGDELHGRMTLRGTFKGPLWGVPGNGQLTEFQATMIARFADGQMALKWQEPNLIGTLRALGLVPQPENAHRKPPYPARVPEIIQRLAWNGLRLQEKPCSHLDLIRVTEPTLNHCAQCAESGDEYPALRLCLICGFVGCCDLSVNKHMEKHCEETGHPLIRSIQPGEAWLWCYADSAFLSSRHLQS